MLPSSESLTLTAGDMSKHVKKMKHIFFAGCAIQTCRQDKYLNVLREKLGIIGIIYSV